MKFTLKVEHAYECKCGREFRSTSRYWLAIRFILHCWARHTLTTREAFVALKHVARGNLP